MERGLVFDGSTVRGLSACRKQEMNFSQTQHHSEHIDYHYGRAREMGLTRFRDGAWLEATNPRQGVVDYRWLDRLAGQCQGQDIQVEFQHYNWPTWMSVSDILAGHAAEALAEVAEQVAAQYRGVFHSWVPCTELGFWTTMAGPWDRWHPRAGHSWWDTYKLTSEVALSVAYALKKGDPSCKLAMSEPYGMGHMGFEDQARPFLTLLGAYDHVAEAEGCHSWRRGHWDLLDEIGLNVYDPQALHPALRDAEQRFPGKSIILAETGHLWQQWIQPETWWQLCQDAGARVAMWGPGGPFRSFDDGRFIGGTLI